VGGTQSPEEAPAHGPSRDRRRHLPRVTLRSRELSHPASERYDPFSRSPHRADGRIVGCVVRALDEAGLLGGCMCIEVGSEDLVKRPNRSRQRLAALISRAVGCFFALQ
jgi:hypothetical protein